jgi:hypothetical protein
MATLNDLPARHGGVLFEQLQQASLSATFYMRAMGLALPGSEGVPTQAEVYSHLVGLANGALQSYFAAQQDAPQAQPPNEIWGEADDDLFALEVTGLSAVEADGFTVTVGFNLLYAGR